MQSFSNIINEENSHDSEYYREDNRLEIVVYNRTKEPEKETVSVFNIFYLIMLHLLLAYDFAIEIYLRY